MKLIAVLLSVVFLSGCLGWLKPKIKLRTEVQEVYRPILYCPAPDWSQLGAPELAISTINNTTEAGEVAKRYRASIKQLEDHLELMRKSLEKYDSTNEAYKELEKEFVNTQNQGNSSTEDK